MAECRKNGEQCPDFYKCTTDGDTVVSSRKVLQQYCFYCMATPRIKVRINDPASTKDARVNGDIRTFRSQAKYYWLIDAREFNKEDDDDMDQSKFNDMFKTAMTAYRKELQDNDCGDWSKEAREWAVSVGLFAGNGTTVDGQPNMMWQDFLTREQAAQLFYRFAKEHGLA